MAVKQALRKKMIERIKALPTNEKQKLEEILQEKLLDTDHWRQAQTIALTVSLPFEWNTSRLIEIGIKEEKQILLPISDGTNRSMTFYKINHLDHLKIGYGGILEPNPDFAEKVLHKAIDLVIVPGFVFNHAGYRIGFGGGFYDRFLAEYAGQTLSMAAEFQMVTDFPINPFDKKIDQLITEQDIYTF